MKEFDIMQTKNYLLIVSDEKTKDLDWYYTKRFSGNKGCVRRNNGGSAIEYKGKIDNWYKEIIGHLPINNSPILEGVALLPEMVIEDDVNKLAESYYTQITQSERTAFNFGHNAATKLYSEADLKEAYENGCEYSSFDDLKQSLKQIKYPKRFVAKNHSIDVCKSFDIETGCKFGGECKCETNENFSFTHITNDQQQKVLVGTYKFD